MALVAVAAIVAVSAVGIWDGIGVAGPQRAAFAVFAALFVVGEVRTIKWLRLDEGWRDHDLVGLRLRTPPARRTRGGP